MRCTTSNVTTALTWGFVNQDAGGIVRPTNPRPSTNDQISSSKFGRGVERACDCGALPCGATSPCFRAIERRWTEANRRKRRSLEMRAAAARLTRLLAVAVGAEGGSDLYQTSSRAVVDGMVVLIGPTNSPDPPQLWWRRSIYCARRTYRVPTALGA